MLEEEATLLEEAEGSQVAGSKCKEITARDKKGQWPFKKARGKQLGKYHRGAAVKMGVLTLARGMCVLGRIAWCIPQGEYLIIFFFIAAPLLVLGASHSSSGVYPTPIPTPQP